MHHQTTSPTIAVIGCGSIGRRHLENLARLGVARRIVVRREAGANPAFQAPAGVEVVHEHAEAIAAGLDLAIIANPTRLHVASALTYLQAGVPVLLEKPISDDLLEAERLLAAAEQAKVPCGVAYCMRYHPAYALARRALQAGQVGQAFQPDCQAGKPDLRATGHIGQPQHARAWFDSFLPAWHPWEDYRASYAARAELGGGVLPTLDHEIDFLNWCLGEPRRAEGMTTRSGLLDSCVDDLASLSIEYDAGVTAELELSFCRNRRQRGFEIEGSEGSIRFDFETAKLTLCGRHHFEEQVLWDGRDFDLNQIYVDLLADFVGAATNRRPFPIPLSAGIAALKVAAQTASI